MLYFLQHCYFLPDATVDWYYCCCCYFRNSDSCGCVLLDARGSTLLMSLLANFVVTVLLVVCVVGSGNHEGGSAEHTYSTGY